MNDALFAGSIPELYERLLVPMMFEAYADDLARRIARAKPRDVLETCAGTGALTRAIASHAPSARIVATDLNQPMLDQSAARGAKKVERKQADALALPFPDASFDVVACAFGTMFFPDKTRGFQESRRVLRPGGVLFFNVWGALADNEFSHAVDEALSARYPDRVPLFFRRTPYAYFDTKLVGGDLSRAGLENVEVEEVDYPSRAESAMDVAIALCQGTPLRNDIEARDPSGLEAATRDAAEAVAKRFGSGRIESKMRAVVFRAESPR